VDRIVDALWDGDPTAGAEATVRTYVSQLRHAFAEEGPPLLARPGGYQLDIDPTCIDAARFETAIVTALAETSTPARLALVDEALNLWRGPPLGEFFGQAWADDTARHWTRLRMLAVEKKVDALLEMGRATDALVLAEISIGEFPLHEPLWVALMLARYRCSRQADALRAAREVRQVLAAELGIEPGPEIAAMERRILAQDPDLLIDRAIAPRTSAAAGDGRDDAAVLPDRSERRPPLPTRLATAVSGNFVGRAVEVERLETAWKAITAQDPRRVMLLAGEPGIGKTTLAAHFACNRYEHGAAVVYGRCDEDLGIPYQPWIDALTQLVRHVPESVLVAHVADRGAHLARVVPELSRRLSVDVPAGGDSDTERFVLFGCVSDLVARASREYPLAVVIDDLHWADPGSVHLLRHVAASDEAMRVGLLGTFRDSDIRTDHPLAEFLAALHRENRCIRIPLSGLNDDDLLLLLETIAGHEMDDQGVALRDALSAETSGNPFFVAEMLRHLAETRVIYQQDGRWVADADVRAVGLPVGLREVVSRRVARLGGGTERILGLAAVIGREFEVSLLSTVAHTDEDALIDLCDVAVEAAVLRTTESPERYSFAHALIEHSLYGAFSPARRARVHKAVAEQLEAVAGRDGGDRVAELAYHWAHAVQPANMSKAVRFAKIAGDRAFEHLAPDDALRWFGQALYLFDRGSGGDVRERIELLIGLGDAQRRCGIAEHRDRLLEAARLADEIDAVDLLVRAAFTNSREWYSGDGRTDDERIAVMRLALDRVPTTETAQRAELLGRLAVELYYADLDERVAIGHEAVTVARSSGDRSVLLRALYAASVASRAPSTLAQRITWDDEACALADELNDPFLSFYAYAERLLTALEAADLNRLRECDDIARNAIKGVPYATAQWTMGFNLAWQAALAGDLIEAEVRAEAALQLGMQGEQTDAITIYGGQLVSIRHQQGRFDEMVSIVEQAMADTPGLLPVYRAILTNMYAYAHRTEDARRLLDADHKNGFATHDNQNWLTALSMWADAAHRIKATAAAAAVRNMIAPYHGHIVTSYITVLPSVAHYLGLLDHTLDRLDDADRWFTEATEIHQRMESPLLVAYTNAAWAALLADRNRGDDHERARQLAERAHAAAIAGGYGYIESDARAVLARLS
jgi:DNA-binding SARP family transcriptional activator